MGESRRTTHSEVAACSSLARHLGAVACDMPVPRPTDLPDFKAPPIDEVAIGVQLIAPIERFVDPHTGLFWQSVKDRYPRAESHQRVEAVPQPLAADGAMSAPFGFPFSASAGSRTFLVALDDSALLQIQNNRFFRNWRRRDDDYPHFESLSTNFIDEFEAFRAFLTKEGLSEKPIGLFEVSYINWVTGLKMSEFLRPGAAVDLDTVGLERWPDNQHWQAVYECRDGTQRPIARLSAQCAPAARTTTTGIEQGTQFAFTFSCPGSPIIERDRIPELLLAAQRFIVRSFTQLTTPLAHERWQRLQ